ncbi:MAG: sodium:calcium antiporter [Frankiales bacterium]|nr:sodium:calcium antiporter [Frankiales bacterium]
MLTAVVLLLVAAGLLVAGAELFVENAAAAAGRLGVTLLAVAVLLAGAEPEELLTAALASAQGRPGLAAGGALGANVTMLTAALGLAALVRPLPIGPRTRLYAVGSALAGGLAVLALLGGVSRVDGALLILAYGGLVAYVWRRERTPPMIGELAEMDDAPEGRNPVLALALVAVGLAVMTGGGALAVGGATRLVEVLGQSDTAVGLTVLGLATTAELFAIVLAAARRGVEEVAVAAVVGSAAYNATATLGVAAVVAPLPANGALGAAVAAAVLPLVVLALSRGGTLGRAAGGGLVAAYVLFVVVVLT